MRFAFIATHAHEFRITTMCRVLQVSKAGYYAWVQRPPRARGVEDEALLARIQRVFTASHQTYGSPRVHAELAATGEAPSVHRVARVMRAAGLRATRPRRFQVTTDVEGWLYLAIVLDLRSRRVIDVPRRAVSRTRIVAVSTRLTSTKRCSPHTT